MATASKPQPARNLKHSQQRVRSPLAALRGYIRAYVSLEGAAVCLLYLALWFWIGLAIDYGFFLLFTVDFVQELPWVFRAGTLTILVAGLLAAILTRVILRLIREFSDSTLALVLEKRFPKLLGDRLITAVELSDPKQALEYGYSAALVEENIHQAAERVEQLPVKQVFNWKRLYLYGFFVVLTSFVFYSLAAAGWATARALRNEGRPMHGLSELNEVSTIWAERNLLLRNTIWPRRAHLEVMEIKAEARDGLGKTQESKDGSDLRVGKGKTVTIKVKAWKYVIADGNAPEGWRQLTLADVNGNPALFGMNVAKDSLPVGWDPEMTVDELEQRLGRFDVRKQAEGANELPARWNLASVQETSGYRALMWSDLSYDRLGGFAVPALPGEWDPKAWPLVAASMTGLGPNEGTMQAIARGMIGPQYISLSVDDVEKQKDAAGAKDVPGLATVFVHLEKLVALRGALEEIDARTTDPSNSRVARRLIVPNSVILYYRNKSGTRSEIPLQAASDNLFTGSFGEMKDTVSYTVRGENYYTARKTINVVDLPQLEKLESEELRPAGLYYRTNDGDLVADEKKVRDADLRGKRQAFNAISISLAGESSIMDVPVGSSVTLTGTSTKPLQSAGVQPALKMIRPVVDVLAGVPLFAPAGNPLVPAFISLPTGLASLAAGTPALEREEVYLPTEPEVAGNTFRATIEVRQEVRMRLIFQDNDGEYGTRQVVINPKEDSAPKVREFAVDDVIRKTKDPKAAGEVYMVAVGARIPFKGKVRDDYGLRNVRYAYTVIPADFLPDAAEKVREAAAVVPMFVGTPVSPLIGLAWLSKLTQPTSSKAPVQFMEMAGFRKEVESRVLGDGRREFLDLATIKGLLPEKQVDPFRVMLREFNLKADPWMDADEDKTEPRTWVSADDPRSLLAFDLPLWKVTYAGNPIKERDESRIQKRYQIDLWLEADDTNVEIGPDGQPGPGKGRSGETMTFLIVPENELLSRIGDEQDIRAKELSEAFKPLPDNRDRLSALVTSLAATNLNSTDVNSMIARADTLEEVLKNSEQGVKGVLAAYDRMVREMRTNQVNPIYTRRIYIDVAKPLSEIDGIGPGSFDRVRNSLAALRKVLDNPDRPALDRAGEARPHAEAAYQHLSDLILKMQRVLDKIGDIGGLNQLIALLHLLESAEEDNYKQISILKTKLEKELLGGESKPAFWREAVREPTGESETTGGLIPFHARHGPPFSGWVRRVGKEVTVRWEG